MSIPFQLLARQLSLLTVPWQIIQCNSQGTGEGAAGAKIEANESGSIAMTAPQSRKGKVTQHLVLQIVLAARPIHLW
jgi:hypothetical protein